VGKERRRYLSYLLRLWQAEGTGKRIWRASLEGAHTGKRLGFASLDALFAYLQRETDATPDPGRDKEETER
jgi:hypothetical protein